MNEITLATTQMRCSANSDENILAAENLVREAAKDGANLVLLQELFRDQYFCQEEDPKHFSLAEPLNGNTMIAHFQTLAKELGIVLPIGFFERSNNSYFNSNAIIDADGVLLGCYRKSHIPHGFGYQEKFYFNPGDTGFKVWDTAVGRIGLGICWDQWFPEAARSMVLQGADILLYPTAIGSTIHSDTLLNSGSDSLRKWQRVMQGHAAANSVVVMASNRIGRETFNDTYIDFYGGSFIADQTGELIVEADQKTQGIKIATLDIDAVRGERENWCYFRDRRPELYDDLLTLDAKR